MLTLLFFLEEVEGWDFDTEYVISPAAPCVKKYRLSCFVVGRTVDLVRRDGRMHTIIATISQFVVRVSTRQVPITWTQLLKMERQNHPSIALTPSQNLRSLWSTARKLLDGLSVSHLWRRSQGLYNSSRDKTEATASFPVYIKHAPHTRTNSK